VTFYAGSEIDRNISNDFRATGGPFLMGTVALGMPVLYLCDCRVSERV